MTNIRKRTAAHMVLMLMAASTLLCSVSLSTAQQPSNAAAKATTTTPADEGLPVKDPLVLQKCGTCHQADAKGNLSRISYVRTTPEGWEEAIKRMIRLNGLQLSPDEARHILRYLSDWHGLAPDEAKRTEYFVEHRMIDETPIPEIDGPCGSCHATAKPLSWRRSGEDWKLLKNMHIAFFPSAENTSFSGNQNRLGQTPGGQGSGRGEQNARTGPDGKPIRPVDDAIAWLAKSEPLHTAEWANWETMIQQPKLEGVWFVSGKAPGKGSFHGKVTVKATDTPGNFTTETWVSYSNGETYTAKGSSIVYTGYAWRGRSDAQSGAAGVAAPSKVREVMMLSRDGSKLEGRWFWGTYEEFGMDVTMTRDVGAPALLDISVASLKTGTNGAKVTIYGQNLPTSITPVGIDLGSGITVTGADAKPDAVTVTVNVAADATPGKRAVTINGLGLPAAIAVYDHIDFLKVTPETSISRLGDQPHAKGYAQFEAEAYAFGPDGKAMTGDDIPLGVVPATWKLEEFVASYGDDDVDFVGKLDSKTGFFTPASDGPNPKRRSMRNNYGDVWVVASYTPEGQAKPVTGRGYMVVSVPQYIQYDQPEVAGK